MNIQPTLAPTLHQEFNFAEDTESSGCCCFWKSRPAHREVFLVSEDHTLTPNANPSHRQRIIANQRLAEIVLDKFEDDPIENDRAFEMLKLRINDNLDNGDPITTKRLMAIISAIYEIKRELEPNDLSTPL